MQVHVRDAGCTAADCAYKAVFDKGLNDWASAIARPFLGLAMPAGGIPMEQAVAIAFRLESFP